MGIAEQHAVTLSAGVSTQGFLVFCVVYSTFLQRAYDQIIHDVALQNLPVIFCIDRAGLVGEDGATHQGVFDIAYLTPIPNMQILAPKDAVELQNTLYTLQKGIKNPVAVRYPRGYSNVEKLNNGFKTLDFSQIEQIKKGEKTAIFSTGTILEEVLKRFSHTHHSIYHFIQIKPLDKEKIINIAKNYTQIITIEEGCAIGGFGSEISRLIAENHPCIGVKNIGVPDHFVEHSTVEEQREEIFVNL